MVEGRARLAGDEHHRVQLRLAQLFEAGGVIEILRLHLDLAGFEDGLRRQRAAAAGGTEIDFAPGQIGQAEIFHARKHMKLF